MTSDPTTARLLTLLNVSAIKHAKRKLADEPFVPAEKLNKKRVVLAPPEKDLEAPVQEEIDEDVGEDESARREIMDGAIARSAITSAVKGA